MFAGISGVGKTTFLTSLKALVPFDCLTGGTLIAAAREQQDRDMLRHSDIAENQALLVAGFHIMRNPKVPLVILDGHVCIATANGLEDIPSSVFEELCVSIMVHLEADPECIQLNRSSDEGRNRPVLDAATLRQHQDHSRAHAESIAADLGIPFYIAKHEGMQELSKAILDRLA